MERERKLKKQGEQKSKLQEEVEGLEEEITRLQRLKIEAMGKLEVEIREKREEEETSLLTKTELQSEQDSEDRARDSRLQKDRELAKRLEQAEGKEIVEESSQTSMKLETPETNNNLSEWTYPQLRDALNTSDDISLISACRKEFHRRLRQYHTWKSKSASSTKKSARKSQQQRCFRVPCVRRTNEIADLSQGKKGFWYAHFDGDYIARQMELHPDEDPILLLAGKDDLRICELPLEMTGLARKKGAEIAPQEFEMVWTTNGGREYMRKAIAANVQSKQDQHLPAK